MLSYLSKLSKIYHLVFLRTSQNTGCNFLYSNADYLKLPTNFVTVYDS